MSHSDLPVRAFSVVVAGTVWATTAADAEVSLRQMTPQPAVVESCIDIHVAQVLDDGGATTATLTQRKAP